METRLHYKTDVHRMLCIKKDLIELGYWIDTIENINSEINDLKIIESQLLRINSLDINLQGLRRRNTLEMGSFCQYEQELKKELEYGKREYDATRAKEHEKKRERYINLMGEFRLLKKIIYQNLSKYQRR